MAQEPPAQTTPDFGQMWSDWITQSERQWNSIMNDMMSTDQYSQSLGSMMDFYLSMQKSFSDQMGRFLNQVNMPSRGDIMAVNDRLLEIENRLAKIEATLTTQARPQANGTDPAGGARKPARTKQPPAAEAS